MRAVSGGGARRCGSMSDAETYYFADDGRFPNSALSLLVYRGALPPDPAAMERTFAAHGWSNGWRDGIFGYHHFHSIAHEVLGIAAGEVRVAFGGPAGHEVMMRAGDAVAIPGRGRAPQHGAERGPAGRRRISRRLGLRHLP